MNLWSIFIGDGAAELMILGWDTNASTENRLWEAGLEQGVRACVGKLWPVSSQRTSKGLDEEEMRVRIYKTPSQVQTEFKLVQNLTHSISSD